LDLYHAIEHVSVLVGLLKITGPNAKQRREALKEASVWLLRVGDIDGVLKGVKQYEAKSGKASALKREKEYFSNNSGRMQYGAYAWAGLFMGSGVVEAACKVIAWARMKQSGMKWLKASAEGMGALRCAIKNNEFWGSYRGCA